MVQGGKFKIKRAYQSMMPQLPKVPWKNIILHKQVHPRFKFILLFAVQQRLATVVRLQKIGIQVPMNYIFCNGDTKTFDHLFFRCPYSNQVWRRMLSWLQLRRSIGTWQQELDWMSKVAKKKGAYAETIYNTFAMVVYNI
ncbi:hypothetical protein P3L10_004650 [Capsicum annuum]|uniref:uncharacterized protein LOC124896205 n=1 Tax=Capsicum annuum TaxID=4072 RepID=UPI001FB04F66|nr:uncharacterized protein LOC124896205 [Capsicum annuum]